MVFERAYCDRMQSEVSTIDPEANPNPGQPCAAAPGLQRIVARESVLGEGMRIRRVLPSRQRRTVGAWCFLNHFGPLDVSAGEGMRVGPHPHTGLQTFTWPIAGEILHRDSLGFEQRIRPGQVNLMTAGRAIAHSEESPADRPALLHGVQLWIALPESHRDIDPAFEHHPEVPTLEREGFRVTVLAGEVFGKHSPVRVYTPLMGVELSGSGGGELRLPLRRDFEYGALVLEGDARFCGEALTVGELLYLPPGHDAATLQTFAAARVLVIGGTPYRDDLVMWWNFVGRNRAEIARFVADWNAGRGFGEVRGYRGERLLSPLLP
jgi:redox-sensitive bicupin YhaK (pirin superfamily)